MRSTHSVLTAQGMGPAVRRASGVLGVRRKRRAGCPGSERIGIGRKVRGFLLAELQQTVDVIVLERSKRLGVKGCVALAAALKQLLPPREQEAVHD